MCYSVFGIGNEVGTSKALAFCEHVHDVHEHWNSFVHRFSNVDLINKSWWNCLQQSVCIVWHEYCWLLEVCIYFVYRHISYINICVYTVYIYIFIHFFTVYLILFVWWWRSINQERERERVCCRPWGLGGESPGWADGASNIPRLC